MANPPRFSEPNNPPRTPADYPSNSDKSKEKVERVTKGAVSQKKKSPGRIFSETFLAGDAQDVGNYIFFDVLLPAAKSTLSDIVSMGIERLLYGGQPAPRGSSRGRTTTSRVNYNGIFDQQRNPPMSSRHRPIQGRQDIRDIILSDRSDAEGVLAGLSDLMRKYGAASVGDFYELVGMSSTYVDCQHGWTDISTATITRLRNGGYSINLPAPKPLD